MTGPVDVDPEIRALAQRIAEVRAAIAEVKDERARLESATEADREDDPDPAVAAMKEKIDAARARLAELAHVEAAPSPERIAEESGRLAVYITGGCFALTGAITFVHFILHTGALTDDKGDWSTSAIFAAPLLVGLVLLAWARFASFRPDKQELDSDSVDP